MDNDITVGGNQEIAAHLPEITVACSLCHGAARSPEDVVAIIVDPVTGAVIDKYVMCALCTDKTLKEARL